MPQATGRIAHCPQTTSGPPTPSALAARIGVPTNFEPARLHASSFASRTDSFSPSASEMLLNDLSNIGNAPVPLSSTPLLFSNQRQTSKQNPHAQKIQLKDGFKARARAKPAPQQSYVLCDTGWSTLASLISIAVLAKFRRFGLDYTLATAQLLRCGSTELLARAGRAVTCCSTTTRREPECANHSAKDADDLADLFRRLPSCYPNNQLSRGLVPTGPSTRPERLLGRPRHARSAAALAATAAREA